MEKEELEQIKRELAAGQLNQHFIFNALNTIKCAIILDQRQACHLLDDFATYLRSNLNARELDEMIPFREEMEQVKAYANIEMARFSKIKVCYDMVEEDFYLPAMSIQPLVANAIGHGICRKKEGGMIKVSCEKNQDYYQIVVSDDGDGFIPELIHSLKVKSGSLENIRIRLEELMGGRLAVESGEKEGTKVILQIPEKAARSREYIF